MNKDHSYISKTYAVVAKPTLTHKTLATFK